MKTLFIAGNEGAGKTPVSNNLEKVLNDNYRIYQRRIPNPAGHEEDFIKIFDGTTKDKRDIRIVLSSASDSQDVIDNMIEKLQLAFDGKRHTNIVLITTARNTGDSSRKYLEKKIAEVCPDNEIIEFPLARINEKAEEAVHEWYHTSVGNILKHILSNEPFNLF